MVDYGGDRAYGSSFRVSLFTSSTVLVRGRERDELRREALEESVHRCNEIQSDCAGVADVWRRSGITRLSMCSMNPDRPI